MSNYKEGRVEVERRLSDIHTEELIQELRIRAIREVNIAKEEVYSIRAWGSLNESKERTLKGSGAALILEIKRQNE